MHAAAGRVPAASSCAPRHPCPARPKPRARAPKQPPARRGAPARQPQGTSNTRNSTNKKLAPSAGHFSRGRDTTGFCGWPVSYRGTSMAFKQLPWHFHGVQTIAVALPWRLNNCRGTSMAFKQFPARVWGPLGLAQNAPAKYEFTFKLDINRSTCHHESYPRCCTYKPFKHLP